ncbi:MAG: hypothetical protein QW566_00120 [Candidatus Jordarchaeales archaeon]|nr:hypothetical protein [Candidatus Bathyarchaeota archaeon]
MVDNPHETLQQISRLLEKNGLMSLSDLERSIGVSRNWLSGFMAALEAIDLVERKGTRTFKLYMIKRK